MSRHLQKEINIIKRKLLSLGTLVEERLQKSVRALMDRNGMLAAQVISGDGEIDGVEVEIEEETLKILALHQPVAIDLRFLVSVLKINSDLERIGDLACNLAERAVTLTEMEAVEMPFDLEDIARRAQEMLHQSLDALINLDSDLARQICAADEAVDAINRENYKKVRNRISENPAQLDRLLPFLSISRYMERIADHATNIAEDVLYMIEGEIVRHDAAKMAPKTVKSAGA